MFVYLVDRERSISRPKYRLTSSSWYLVQRLRQRCWWYLPARHTATYVTFTDRKWPIYGSIFYGSMVPNNSMKRNITRLRRAHLPRTVSSRETRGFHRPDRRTCSTAVADCRLEAASNRNFCPTFVRRYSYLLRGLKAQVYTRLTPIDIRRVSDRTTSNNDRWT